MPKHIKIQSIIKKENMERQKLKIKKYFLPRELCLTASRDRLDLQHIQFENMLCQMICFVTICFDMRYVLYVLGKGDVQLSQKPIL